MGDFEATVLRAGLHFGECPRWHDGRLWYSDFYDHAVHALATDGVDAKLVSESWGRVVEGSGERHEITSAGSQLVEKGFV